MTQLRNLVNIYVRNQDGSGRQVAPHVELMDAEVICQAFEDRGLEVLVDIPAFGLSQNTIRWSGGYPGADAVPWRDYLKTRATTESTREAFNLLYRTKSHEDKYGDSYDSWEYP